MIRVIKKIPVFFLFLAEFILCVHMSIPHDHHMPDTSASQEERCPVSENETDHHRGFPVHCHAFNDLASEKAVTFSIIKPVHHIAFMQDSIVEKEVSKIQLTWIRVFDLFIQPVTSDITEFSSLRAPPMLG